MSEEKIDKSELANGCFAAILLLTALGLSISNYFNTKELNHRLDLVERRQDEFAERFNKYQIEEREYTDSNDGYIENKITEVKEYVEQLSDGIESIVRDRVIGKFDNRDDFGECSRKKND